MAAGFIDLFRKVWGWLAVDSGVVEEVGAQMCVAASGCFVPCSQSEIGEFAACSSRTSQHATSFTSETWTLAPRVGSHVTGMTSAKGVGCA